jgi:site-specific recombinase XerD
MSEVCGALRSMAKELQHTAVAATSAVTGELLDPASLATRAAEVAARQRSPETRRTYAAVYRGFGAFLGPDATAEELTSETVRSYRDQLERAGRTPATIAKHLSALRQLAASLDADPAIRTVRSQSVARGDPRALSGDEFARLLRMPDRRTRKGKRDLALLHLLGSAGLRRAEAANLLIADVDERRRAGDTRLRQAIAHSTSWWVTVRYGKRGRTRAIPLDEDALAALTAWVKTRPAAPTEQMLLSLPRTGQPPRALSTRDIARIVARYAEAAGPPRTVGPRTCCATRSAPTLLTPPPGNCSTPSTTWRRCRAGRTPQPSAEPTVMSCRALPPPARRAREPIPCRVAGSSHPLPAPTEPCLRCSHTALRDGGLLTPPPAGWRPRIIPIAPVVAGRGRPCAGARGGAARPGTRARVR